MVRNVIEGGFRSSKMAAGSHFVKQKSKLRIDLIPHDGENCDRNGFLVIQNGRRQPFCEQNPKQINKELSIDLKWRDMRSNYVFQILSDFRSSKMAAGSHFVKKKLKK